jgi:hypothetical protein
MDLVGHEEFCEGAVVVNFGQRKDGGHGGS